MFLRILFSSLLIAMIGTGFGCSGSERSDVIATVGDHQITVSRFEFAASENPMTITDVSEEGKRQLVDDLVDRALLVQEARRLGFSDSPEYRKEIQDTKMSAVNEALYESLISSSVRVSEKEVKALWESRAREWRVSQIFAFSNAEILQSIRRIRNGEEFDEVAQAGSVEPGSTARGGDIGYVTAGEMPREIHEAVSELAVGEWAGPIEAGAGYYLIKLTDERERNRRPYPEVKSELHELLRMRKERALVLRFVSHLKERYRLEQVPSSFEVLARLWQNRSTEELLASGGDLRSLGFTEEQLLLPLVQYDGGSYTIQDLFGELLGSTTAERPPSSSDPLLKLFIEDRVVDRLIMKSARIRGFDRDAAVDELVEIQEETYLLSQIWNRVIVPSAVLTPEERDAIRSSNSAAAASETLLAQEESRLFQRKRQDALGKLVMKLRTEHPPIIHEDVLSRVPWPVAPRENI